jgi:hypothetical protein
MNLTDILKAKRQGGKVPTMEKIGRSGLQEQRAAQGLCIECGEHPTGATSYLCGHCEGRVSLEDVRKELDGTRRRVLGE